jgi:hypothetical protein
MEEQGVSDFVGDIASLANDRVTIVVPDRLVHAFEDGHGREGRRITFDQVADSRGCPVPKVAQRVDRDLEKVRQGERIKRIDWCQSQIRSDLSRQGVCLFLEPASQHWLQPVSSGHRRPR